MEGWLLVTAVWGFIILFFIFLYYFPLNLWLTAIFSGVYISFFRVIALRQQNVPPSIVIDYLITAKKAGIKLKLNDLANHYMAGGHVPSVVKALIAAKNANMKLSFQEATNMDLAGRDVFEAVIISINSAILDTGNLICTTKDGIKLLIKAKVALRAIFDKILGYQGEETILNRVKQIVIDYVNACENHKVIISQLDILVKLIKDKLIYDDTAFDVLDVFVSDIDIITPESALGMKLQRETNLGSIIVGSEGEVEGLITPESALAEINGYQVDVFYHQTKFKEGTKIKVKAIRNEQIYVELIDDIEYTNSLLSPKEKLINLRGEEKFSYKQWQERNVTPSSGILCLEMESITNSFLDQLIGTDLEKLSEKQLKKLFKNALRQFKKTDFDTEEKEFIADIFYKIAEIVNINISGNLNIWRYGFILGNLINLFSKVN